MCVALHSRIAPEVVFQTRVVAEQSFRVESQGGGPACRRTQSVMGPYWEIARTALGVSRGPRECLVISTQGLRDCLEDFLRTSNRPALLCCKCDSLASTQTLCSSVVQDSVLCSRQSRGLVLMIGSVATISTCSTFVLCTIHVFVCLSVWVSVW